MSGRDRLLRLHLLAGFVLAAVGIGTLGAAVPANWTYVDAHGTERSFAPSEACDNVVDGGTIAADQKGCANPVYQPATLTSVTLPQGGTGDLEYLWMTTESDPSTGAPVSWSLIPGSTSADYTPGALTATTYYMRCARRAGCTEYGGESNYVTILIDCCENITDGGTIDGDQVACGVPFDPALIRNTGAAAGGANTLYYTWYESTTTDVYTPGSAEWTVATPLTTPYFDPGAVAQVTHYVRVAQREYCAEPGAWSNVVTISAHPNPTLKADVTDVTCFGESDGAAAVTIINAQEPFTYRWLDDPAAGLARSGLTAGTYEFEISDGNGCTATEQVVVGTPDELTVAIAGDFDVCAFTSADLTTGVAGGTEPYAYAWNTGATTANLKQQPAGTYEVTVTDANGCTATATLEVAPPVALTASATFTEPVCYGPNGTIDVTPAGGAAPFDYAWVPNVSTGASAQDLPGGTYVVTVTDANGCEATASVTLDDTPPIAIATTKVDVTCNADADGEIDATVIGGTAPYGFVWDNGATTEDLADLAPGTYVLTVTDARGCEATATVEIVEPDALEVTLTVVQPVCAEDGGTLTADITGGTPAYSFDWGTEGRPNEQTISNLPGGTYAVNVVDAGGCTASATATIETVDTLVLGVVGVDATCPGEDDGSATVTIAGGEPGYAIEWSDPAAQTTATATGLAAGTYTVAVTDARGCLKTEEVVIENESTGPQIAADTTDISCALGADASIDLTVTEGIAPYTFSWTDDGVLSPVTTEDRSGLSAGTYEVTVTDAIGCEAVRTFTFEDPEGLEVTAVPTSFFANYFHVSAYDATDGAAAAQIEGGTAPYTYEWTQDGAPVGAAAAAGGLAGGTVSVTVTDAKGCTATHDTLLIEPSMISDFVWEDENGDGIQDPTEPGLAGVTVTLTGTDFMGLQVNFSATSDADGLYRFDVLPKGDYTLSFDLPRFQDYLFSPVDQGGDDTKDSDMDPISLLINRTVADFGIGDYDTDAGFIPRTSAIVISDRVWYDADHDGLQDPFEVDVQGVRMELYRSSDDLFIDATVSNEDGEYFFNDVVPGTYYVTADPTSSSVAAAYVASPKDNVPGNDIEDSDFDPATMRSDDIVVTATTSDINTLDLGLHADCDEVDTPGAIAGDETVCRGEVPMPIASVSTPSGAAAYQWLRSRNENYLGPNDPNWEVIPGATAATYSPSGITTTWHYIRLAAVAGCADFTGATEKVTKTVNPLPSAEIASAPRNVCLSQAYDFTADSTAAVTFEWDFREYAVNRYATGRVVQGVEFTTHSQQFFVLLTVTDANGCQARDSVRVFTRNCFGPGLVNGLSASTRGGTNTVAWTAMSLVAGSYFDVERADGPDGAFEVIESVDCLGLDAWIDYAYVDAFAPSGEVRYRIAHRAPSAPDGRSGEVALSVDQHGLATRAYPNPVSEELTVEVATERATAARYEIVDAFGRTVLAGTLDPGRSRLDVSGLSAGSYYLRTANDDGETAVTTLVKR